MNISPNVIGTRRSPTHKHSATLSTTESTQTFQNMNVPIQDPRVHTIVGAAVILRPEYLKHDCYWYLFFFSLALILCLFAAASRENFPSRWNFPFNHHHLSSSQKKNQSIQQIWDCRRWLQNRSSNKSSLVPYQAIVIPQNLPLAILLSPPSSGGNQFNSPYFKRKLYSFNENKTAVCKHLVRWLERDFSNKNLSFCRLILFEEGEHEDEE